MELDVMIFVFWMLSSKPAFSLYLIFTKKLFSPSSVSALKVVSAAYLKLVTFLWAVPSSLCFIQPGISRDELYKLNRQGDSVQPWRTPFPTLNLSHCSMSISNCCFLTSIQVSQETGKVFFSSHLFKNFSQFVVINSQWLSCIQWSRSRFFSGIFLLLYDPENVAIGSLVPLLFVNPACSSVSVQYIHCWSLAWRILSIILLAWMVT